MAGLIPVGGGGAPPPPTCFNCGAPALGPCALCRVMICADDECSAIVKEPGLPEVVLCTGCLGHRSRLAMSRRAAPAMLLLGASLIIAFLLFGGASTVTALGTIAGALAILFALAVAVARWQWRARLSAARRHKGEG